MATKLTRIEREIADLDELAARREEERDLERERV
jgi:hypothetical protein